MYIVDEYDVKMDESELMKETGGLHRKPVRKSHVEIANQLLPKYS